ncbi:hypothetical protein FACS1894145_5220 [Bacteroidia bacterium]|nr:hypothetical protein FACS1894145_5220 [Bacteroidia bacterium]
MYCQQNKKLIQKIQEKFMETTVTEKTLNKAKRQEEKPEKLSKAAIWRRNNPQGLFIIVDRKAVMK